MTIRIERPRDWQPKHPTDDRFYKIDWSDWLPTGVTISTSDWTLEAGITESNDTIEDTSTSTQVQIAGGTTGTTYSVTNTITTSDGQTVVGLIDLQVSSTTNNV